MLHLPRACVCGLKIHKQARRLSCRCVQISLPLEPGKAHTGPRAQPTRLLPAEPALLLPSCCCSRSCCIPGEVSCRAGGRAAWHILCGCGSSQTLSHCVCDSQTCCAPLWSVFSHRGHRSWFSLWDGGRGTLKELPSSESSAKAPWTVCAVLTLHISRRGKRDHKRVFKKITL